MGVQVNKQHHPPMPKCTQTQSEKFNFGRIGRKAIVANFDGGDVGSDGGLLLLKSLDEKLALTRAATRAVVDPRNPDLIEHPMQSLIAQRLYALCCGYEGPSDHDRLRHDSILQTALGRDGLLGSSPESMPLELSGTSCPATITLLRGWRSSQPLRSRLSRYSCIA